MSAAFKCPKCLLAHLTEDSSFTPLCSACQRPCFLLSLIEAAFELPPVGLTYRELVGPPSNRKTPPLSWFEQESHLVHRGDLGRLVKKYRREGRS